MSNLKILCVSCYNNSKICENNLLLDISDTVNFVDVFKVECMHTVIFVYLYFIEIQSG